VVSDKPAHIIEIPDSLGRDVDKAREGKLKGTLPVEAFMSEESIAQVADQSAVASAPVHAEDLRAISPAEAATRSTFDGETLPGHPVPRRVIPAPFQRPRISIDHHGRSWATCDAADVKEGDVVVDIGRIACDAETVIRYETVAGVPDVAVGMKVILTGVSGNRVPFEPGTRVRAFRLAELWAARAAGAVSGSSTSAAGPGSRPTVTPPTSM
jgi:hypothetical protein